MRWRQIFVRDAQFAPHRRTMICRERTTDMSLAHSDNSPGFRGYVAGEQRIWSRRTKISRGCSEITRGNTTDMPPVHHYNSPVIYSRCLRFSVRSREAPQPRKAPSPPTCIREEPCARDHSLYPPDNEFSAGCHSLSLAVNSIASGGE